MENNINIGKIEGKLGYTFKEKQLLLRAFTHSSFVGGNEYLGNYERLEFLGDAVTEIAVSRYLYDNFPSYDQEELTDCRKSSVDKDTLASVVDDLEIMRYLRVGVGTKPSKRMKGDLFEAIIGAIAVDAGDIEPACKSVLSLLRDKIAKKPDYITEVKEYCDRRRLSVGFEVTEQSNNNGEAHFVGNLFIDGKVVAFGAGRTKKEAKKDASRKFYKKIQKQE